jgi:hypothetical protein
MTLSPKENKVLYHRQACDVVGARSFKPKAVFSATGVRKVEFTTLQNLTYYHFLEGTYYYVLSDDGQSVVRQS